MVRICHFDTGVDEGAAAVAFVDEEALDRNLFLVQSDSTTSSGAGMLQIGAEEKAMSVDLIAAPMNRAPAPANPVRLRRLRRYQSCGPDACCASKRGIKNIRSWPVAEFVVEQIFVRDPCGATKASATSLGPRKASTSPGN